MRAGQQANRPASPTVSDLRGRLEGRLVVLEPLSIVHEQGLAEAARDGELFTWMPSGLADSRRAMRGSVIDDEWPQLKLRLQDRLARLPATDG